ncbi:MAG: hypothetical protein KGL39_22450 [Patescibacteria group bacterium]|nr:hypothetical protein [Patescibacteria group bacterium]
MATLLARGLLASIAASLSRCLSAQIPAQLAESGLGLGGEIEFTSAEGVEQAVRLDGGSNLRRDRFLFVVHLGVSP